MGFRLDNKGGTILFDGFELLRNPGADEQLSKEECHTAATLHGSAINVVSSSDRPKGCHYSPEDISSPAFFYNAYAGKAFSSTAYGGDYLAVCKGGTAFPSPPSPPLPLEDTISKLAVAGEAAGYDGIPVAALLIAAMLIAIPLVGTMYVAARHGVGKVPLWFKLHLSHSNPNVACFYLPTEERCAMRQKLCGRKGGSLAPTQAVADVEFGARHRPRPLLPTPKGSAPPASALASSREAELEAQVAELTQKNEQLVKEKTKKRGELVTTPAAIVTAQAWLKKAENAAVSC